MKDDEQQLFRMLAEHTEFVHVRKVIAALGIPEKRAAYILEKWASCGWYDYGVSIFAGWLTPKARQHAERLAKVRKGEG